MENVRSSPPSRRRQRGASRLPRPCPSCRQSQGHACRQIRLDRTESGSLDLWTWSSLPAQFVLQLHPRSHLRADAAESIDLDAHDQALLAGLTIRVLVHPEEPFREFVGVGVGSSLRTRRGAVENEIRLRFGTILNRDDDPRVALEVLRLLAPFLAFGSRLPVVFQESWYRRTDPQAPASCRKTIRPSPVPSSRRSRCGRGVAAPSVVRVRIVGR